MLYVKDLRVYYYTGVRIVRAVDGIDLETKPGQTIAIVGESGSGKTTLAHSILRILPRNAKIVGGQILYKGIDLLRLSEEEFSKIRGRDISIVFQDPYSYLNPVLTIREQIGEVLIYKLGMREEEADEEVIKLLSMVKIRDPKRVAQYYPYQLSGGMAQRVMIAMALASRPSILIADEPTSALDPTLQIEILKLLKDLKKSMGFSILLITHDLGVVSFMAEYVYIMYAGKILEHGDVKTIFKDPKHPYTQALLASLPDIRKNNMELTPIRGSIPDLSNPPMGCRFSPRCKFAMEICTKAEPKLIEVGRSHVSCFLYNS
jgi:oligopeptide/dipeptide ABC transporter ATP-binding protein